MAAPCLSFCQIWGRRTELGAGRLKVTQRRCFSTLLGRENHGRESHQGARSGLGRSCSWQTPLTSPPGSFVQPPRDIPPGGPPQAPARGQPRAPAGWNTTTLGPHPSLWLEISPFITIFPPHFGSFGRIGSLRMLSLTSQVTGGGRTKAGTAGQGGGDGAGRPGVAVLSPRSCSRGRILPHVL